jgi:vacuolar-type H+-ATPase subunit C/Vma6
VGGKKPRNLKFEISSSLTAAGGSILQWTEDILTTHGRAMVVRKQNSTKLGRMKEQRSTNITEENGNHTEETQHEPCPIPPNIRGGQEKGREWNKRIR